MSASTSNTQNATSQPAQELQTFSATGTTATGTGVVANSMKSSSQVNEITNSKLINQPSVSSSSTLVTVIQVNQNETETTAINKPKQEVVENKPPIVEPRSSSVKEKILLFTNNQRPARPLSQIITKEIKPSCKSYSSNFLKNKPTNKLAVSSPSINTITNAANKKLPITSSAISATPSNNQQTSASACSLVSIIDNQKTTNLKESIKYFSTSTITTTSAANSALQGNQSFLSSNLTSSLMNVNENNLNESKDEPTNEPNFKSVKDRIAYFSSQLKKSNPSSAKKIGGQNESSSSLDFILSTSSMLNKMNNNCNSMANQIEIISSATMAALEAKRNNPGHDSLKSAYKQSSSAYCSSFNSKNWFILFKN